MRNPSRSGRSGRSGRSQARFDQVLRQCRNQEVEASQYAVLSWIALANRRLHTQQRKLLRRHEHQLGLSHTAQAIFQCVQEEPIPTVSQALRRLQNALRSGDSAFNFLYNCCKMATCDGNLSTAENHCLRFLSDASGRRNWMLKDAFREAVGQDIPEPQDPSTRIYWDMEELRRRRRDMRSQEKQQQERERYHRHETRWERNRNQQWDWKDHEWNWQQHQRQHQYHDHNRGRSHSSGSGISKETQEALQYLNLTWPTTRKAVDQAFQKLAQIHHPDKHAGKGEAAIRNATQTFQVISQAREHLRRRLA